MNFNDTLPYLFAQISTFFKTEMEKELRDFNLHSGQVFILFELWRTDGISQVELSNNLKLSAPTINKMVKSLSKNGFVASAACPKDGRVMLVFLTPQGAAVRPRVEEKWRKLEDILIANMTATEQLVLGQLFGRLIENLQARKNSVS
jgi:DNA-binding MarR family transcriptional regulator